MITRAQLETRLRASKARLIARQVLRSAFTGIAGAASGLGLGVVFLDLLPRLLFAQSAGLPALLIAASAGAVGGVLLELRRYRMPSLQETALALEARLERDSGALAAALRVNDADPFLTPLLARAEADLSAAERAPAPVLIRTRKLVLVPLMALASGVAFAAVITAEPPARAQATVTAKGGDPATWQGLDVGGGRSQAEAEAYREALGMKEQSATLNRSAATLRDAQASSAHPQALREAKDALANADNQMTGIAPEELPEGVPADQAEREKLADAFEAAAGKLAAAAAKAGSEAGSEDTGRNGEFTPGEIATVLVPFAVTARVADTPVQAYASQTPARRALAQRAVAALEDLQK
jgi:hypothetical protein